MLGEALSQGELVFVQQTVPWWRLVGMMRDDIPSSHLFINLVLFIGIFVVFLLLKLIWL
jgi:hypothetical protein